MRSQFNKYRRNKVDAMAFDYDFGSLMHYGKRTFSKNRKPTIRSIRNPNIRLGRSDGFSAMDIRKINKLYHCGSKYNTIQYIIKWVRHFPFNTAFFRRFDWLNMTCTVLIYRHIKRKNPVSHFCRRTKLKRKFCRLTRT